MLDPLACLGTYTWEDFYPHYDYIDIGFVKHRDNRSFTVEDVAIAFNTTPLETDGALASPSPVSIAEGYGVPEQTPLEVLLQDQRINTAEADNCSVSSWGIRPATNYPYPSSISTPAPSFLRDLKDSGQIPSLSWGYTAGAYYQSKGQRNCLCTTV